MRRKTVRRYEYERVWDDVFGQQSGDKFCEGRRTHLAGEDNGRCGFLFPRFRKQGKGFGRSANDDHHVFRHCSYLGGVLGLGDLGGRGFFLCVSGGDIATGGGPGCGRVACCRENLVLCGFGFAHFRGFTKIREPDREPYRLRGAVRRCSEGFGTRREHPAGA